MKELFFILILIGVAHPYTVSIGTCTKYETDGLGCKQCISGYHLLNKECQVDIKWCTEYIENLCSKCKNNTLLVNNMCCDDECFQKLLKNGTNLNTTSFFQTNIQRVQNLIDKASKKLGTSQLSKLVGIDIQNFNQIQRWFFLFTISNLNFKRIVIDINKNNQQYIIIDFSFIRNPQQFNLIQWKQIQDKSIIATLFSDLYSNPNQYTELIVNRANLVNIDQFEIITISPKTATARIIYQTQQKLVILKENVLSVDNSSNISTKSNDTLISTNQTQNISNSSTNLQIKSSGVSKKIGCEIHTTYSPPFSKEVKAWADQLSKIKDQSIFKSLNIKNSETPIIRGPGLTLRRIVMSEFCTAPFRQIAYVEGDSASKIQYFTYYLELNDPDTGKQWFYLGNRNKTQPTTIYSNPGGFPIQMVDPSFTVYPYATLFSQKGILDFYRQNLPSDQQAIDLTVKVNTTTERDRDMGKIKRFAIDGVDVKRIKYTKTGWIILKQPDFFPPVEQYKWSVMCEEGQVTQSVIIGTSGVQSQQNTSKQLDISHISAFVPYQLTYIGVDIEAEIDVNQPLSSVVSFLKNTPSWNYKIKSILEVRVSQNLIRFQFIVQNQLSVLKYVVQYSLLNDQIKILTIDQLSSNPNSNLSKLAQPSQLQRKAAQATIYSNQDANTNSQHPKIQSDGPMTHTTFEPPFSPEIQELIHQLSIKKNQQLLKNVKQSQTPLISGPGLTLRRLVMSEFCTAPYRQIAYVEGDSFSTKEYFTYYFEYNDPDTGKQWFYLGNASKTQPTTIYSNPGGFPIQMVDPSFTVYPYATLFSQKGILDKYRNNLTPDQQAIDITVTVNATSEKDRNMGKVKRFAIDGFDINDQKYAKIGWMVIEPPEFLPENDPDGFLSVMCEEGQVTQSMIIGSSGSKKDNHLTVDYSN